MYCPKCKRMVGKEKNCFICGGQTVPDNEAPVLEEETIYSPDVSKINIKTPNKVSMLTCVVIIMAGIICLMLGRFRLGVEFLVWGCVVNLMVRIINALHRSELIQKAILKEILDNKKHDDSNSTKE